MDTEELHDGASASANDDLRSTLAAAVAEHTDVPPAPREAPASDKPAVERARDPGGRFATKADGEAAKPAAAREATKPETSGETSTETASAATRKAPASWSKETQEQFATLPPAIQAEILKREGDVAKGFEERATKVRAADEFERVVAPFRDTLAQLGVQPHQAVGKMLAVERDLRRDPVGTIHRIAQAYGVNLGGQAQRAAQPSQAPHPAEQRLARLEQTIEEQRRQEQQRNVEAVQTSIVDFAKANEHFESVKSTMGQLINSGRATDLKDAYEQACWLDPTIRETLIAKRSAPAEADAKRRADQAAVDRARGAAVSVKGAPSGAPASAPKATLRDEIAAALKG